MYKISKLIISKLREKLTQESAEANLVLEIIKLAIDEVEYKDREISRNALGFFKGGDYIYHAHSIGIEPGYLVELIIKHTAWGRQHLKPIRYKDDRLCIQNLNLFEIA